MMKIRIAMSAIALLSFNFSVYSQNWSLSGNSLTGNEVIGSTNSKGIRLITSGSTRVFIQADGNVGIGTDRTKGFRLSVDGKVRAREVYVNMDAWADHVFAPCYPLMSYKRLSEFIEENRHLPGMLKEEEVLDKDVALGEFQVSLLEQIEKLTLYILDLNQRLILLEEQLEIETANE